MKRLLAVSLCLALTACASAPVLRDRMPGPSAIELTQAPFFPQQRYQCGPAALATVLAAGGITVTPEQLAPQVFVPARAGSLQLELVGAVRRQGRVPLKIRGEVAALATALAAGHPVLVLQNLLFDKWPRWHYAVVVGLDPERDEVILRSGTEQRLVMSARSFMKTWSRGGHWGLVVADPAQPPAFIGARAWLEAANGLETTGRSAEALQAYRVAVERWPEEVLTWQALGNALHASADRVGAVAAYRQALQLRPLPETFNNLAHVHGELGCVEDGEKLIDEGLASTVSLWRAQLIETRHELAAMPRKACAY